MFIKREKAPFVNGTKIAAAGLIMFSVCLVALIYSIYDLTETYGYRINAIEKKLGGREKIYCDHEKSVRKVERSTVRIIGGEAEGSGFVIQKDGLILTNFHVIEFEPNPKVVLFDNTFETGKIIMADKDSDLAVIKIDKEVQATEWGKPSELGPAEELYAIGYPLGGQLAGEASVSKGSLSARRYSKDVGVEYLQTDITLNGGLSGGPMINVCGEVVGVNTAGLSGLGMAISSDSIMEKIEEMSKAEDPVADVEKVVFAPNESPLEAVRAFYNYLKARKLDKAFELLSDNFIAGYDFDQWKQGYAPLLDTTVLKIEYTKNKQNRVDIKLTTKDMVGDEIVYKYFEGYWDVRKVEDKWLLWEASIQEVEDPDFMWFYQ